MIWFLSTYPTSSPTVLSWPTLALLLLHHAKLSPTSQPLTLFLLPRMLLPQIFLQHPASHQSNLCSSFISSQGLSLNPLSKVTPRYPGFNSILFFFWYSPLLEILFIYLFVTCFPMRVSAPQGRNKGLCFSCSWLHRHCQEQHPTPGTCGRNWVVSLSSHDSPHTTSASWKITFPSLSYSSRSAWDLAPSSKHPVWDWRWVMRGGGHKEEDRICRWVAKATGFFEAATGKFLESRT